jgi:hypothetical protein
MGRGRIEKKSFMLLTTLSDFLYHVQKNHSPFEVIWFPDQICRRGRKSKFDFPKYSSGMCCCYQDKKFHQWYSILRMQGSLNQVNRWSHKVWVIWPGQARARIKKYPGSVKYCLRNITGHHWDLTREPIYTRGKWDQRNWRISSIPFYSHSLQSYCLPNWSITNWENC